MGTEVETPSGQISIENLNVGDEVLTVSQAHPGAPPGVGRVTTIFRDESPLILWMLIDPGELLGVTPAHEVWTYQDGWTVAGRLQVGDTFVGLDGNPRSVLAIFVDRTPTPVYNLEVDGTFTYFVHSIWVHNNSCTRAIRAVAEWHHLLPLQFADEFRAVGLRVEEFYLPLEVDFHKTLHGKGGRWIDSWNGKWSEFWATHDPQSTTDSEVLAYYGDLFNEFFVGE